MRAVIKAATGAKITWSQSFITAAEKIELGGTFAVVEGDEGHRVHVSEHLYDWLEVTDQKIAQRIAVALRGHIGRQIDRDDMLSLPVPNDDVSEAQFLSIVADHLNSDLEGPIEEAVDRIDALVGPALGLDVTDIAEVRLELLDDPFLKHIKPRYPASATRLHGYRTGLDSSERYA